MKYAPVSIVPKLPSSILIANVTKEWLNGKFESNFVSRLLCVHFCPRRVHEKAKRMKNREQSAFESIVERFAFFITFFFKSYTIRRQFEQFLLDAHSFHFTVKYQGKSLMSDWFNLIKKRGIKLGFQHLMNIVPWNPWIYAGGSSIDGYMI